MTSHDEDPIITEVRQAREALLTRFNGDLDALVTYLQQRTDEDTRAGRPVIARPPRRPRNWTPATKKVG